MKASADPSIPYMAGAARQELENSYNNPLGSYTSPAVHEALDRSAGQRLAMDAATATQASQREADNINYGRRAGEAAALAPQLIQTGGSSSGSGTMQGTQTQSGGFWSGLLTAAIGGAAQGLA